MLLYLYIGFLGILCLLAIAGRVHEPALNLAVPALAKIGDALLIDFNLMLVCLLLSLIPVKWPIHLIVFFVILGTSEGLVRVAFNLTWAQLPVILIFLLQMGSSVWFVCWLARIGLHVIDLTRFGRSDHYLKNWAQSLVVALKPAGLPLSISLVVNVITRALIA